MPEKHANKVKDEGRQAHRRGLPMSANPYLGGVSGTRADEELWNEGWLEENRNGDK
jgi:hypothetical protein